MEESGKRFFTEMRRLRTKYPAWALPRRLRAEDIVDHIPSREELRGEDPPQELVEQVRSFLRGECAGTGDVEALTDRIFEEVRRYCEEAYYREEARLVRKRGEEIERQQAKEHAWSYPQGNPYEQLKKFFKKYEDALDELGHEARNTLAFEIPEAMAFHCKLAILAGAFTLRNDLFFRMEGDRLTEVAKRFKRGPDSAVEMKEMQAKLTDLLRDHLGRSPKQNEIKSLEKILGMSLAVKRTVARANAKLHPEDFLNRFKQDGVVPETITDRQARLDALRKANAKLRKYRNSDKRALTEEEEERLYASIWPN